MALDRKGRSGHGRGMSARTGGAARPRQSNFELLRLLAMLAIVLGHLFTEGHLLSRAGDGGALYASHRGTACCRCWWRRSGLPLRGRAATAPGANMRSG